jgi:hypothetical protein
MGNEIKLPSGWTVCIKTPSITELEDWIKIAEETIECPFTTTDKSEQPKENL